MRRLGTLTTRASSSRAVRPSPRRPASRSVCRPGPMRPRCASVTASPIVPWPHHADDADIVEKDDASGAARSTGSTAGADQRIVSRVARSRRSCAKGRNSVAKRVRRSDSGPRPRSGPPSMMIRSARPRCGNRRRASMISRLGGWRAMRYGSSRSSFPQAWPFFRSVSVQVTVFQSGSRISRAPAFATSTRLRRAPRHREKNVCWIACLCGPVSIWTPSRERRLPPAAPARGYRPHIVTWWKRPRCRVWSRV